MLLSCYGFLSILYDVVPLLLSVVLLSWRGTALVLYSYGVVLLRCGVVLLCRCCGVVVVVQICCVV